MEINASSEIPIIEEGAILTNRVQTPIEERILVTPQAPLV
jgi:hypothetical protein